MLLLAPSINRQSTHYRYLEDAPMIQAALFRGARYTPVDYTGGYDSCLLTPAGAITHYFFLREGVALTEKPRKVLPSPDLIWQMRPLLQGPGRSDC